MRKFLIKASLAAALLTPASSAMADTPNLASYTVLGTVFGGNNISSFDVQFLFGRAAYTNTLYYQLGAGSNWVKILTAVGNFPNQTANPAPGASFNVLLGGPYTGNITFALCQGALASNVPAANFAANCSGDGPFFSGAGSTNVRVLSGADWNSIRGTDGAPSIYNTVFGFEDQELAASDMDFNDVVFSTNLTTVTPEPSAILLMAAGLAGVAAVARRRRTNA